MDGWVGFEERLDAPAVGEVGGGDELGGSRSVEDEQLGMHGTVLSLAPGPAAREFHRAAGPRLAPQWNHRDRHALVRRAPP
ncbi:hypothetical protein GCM10023258_03060 [Terrabacter aeriphilus]|uniref:Uncharacterized protein n=1 Tax=Terrabacter aeriphilus TaxID=515662 RepID=A0ABP9J0W0_9MICO